MLCHLNDRAIPCYLIIGEWQLSFTVHRIGHRVV